MHRHGRRPLSLFSLFKSLTWLLLCGLAAVSPWLHAETKTVCTVTINSSDEKDVFQRSLPRDKYRFVELVEAGNPNWLASACNRGVRCDALIISGHFDGGTEFYTDRFDDREFLTVHELERQSCSNSCTGVLAQLKEVYLFGCNSLKTEPSYCVSPEVARSLVASGHSAADATRLATSLGERYGQSNRDRLRHVFKDVPVLYGFSSKAPLGRYAGPLLERYFRSAPAGEVASGRTSSTLVNLFAASSMTATAGLTDADPHASFRTDVCGLADDRRTTAQKVAFMHELLRREMAEVRMLLDQLERYAATLKPVPSRVPEVAAALAAIERDRGSRERFLAFARDADDASVQVRMLALARKLGWLLPAQEQAEWVHMIAARMGRNGVGKAEVDLICELELGREASPALQLQASGAAQHNKVTHSAVLACLGSAKDHARTVRALTSANDDDVAIAQVYLRHRSLADLAELRAVTNSISHMATPTAQVRALDTLARQRLTDAQSLQEIARLFPLARTLDVQRAIAGILIRADVRVLARADLARTLRQHRLKSPDGNDVIDALIRML